MESEKNEKVSKHSLDSDEENSGDEDKYDVLQGSDIEGEEEGDLAMDGEIKVTPFNLKEELEEGHFDKSGHFHWDKEKEIRDDWLDSIDWIKVKPGQSQIDSRKRKRSCSGSSVDSEDGHSIKSLSEYKEQKPYAKILVFMKPDENVRQTLQRLGRKTKKISSVERIKMKKNCTVNEDAKLVAEFSALTNEILYRTGNTNIYEESYDTVKIKANHIPTSTASTAELDMYADDFEVKEKSAHVEGKVEGKVIENENCVMWEFKWKRDDNEIHGPFSTEQMQSWTDESYFKDGVYVRKFGEENFYQNIRIDFELYL